MTYFLTSFSSYGGLGKGIIGAALWHLVYRRGGKSDTDLKNELTSTIGEVVSNHHDSCITMEGFWDLPPHSNIEIRLEDFFDFIALPHTVNLLIMEDMKLSNETDANEARRTSTIFGEAVHSEPTDETMDNMILEISRGQVRPLYPLLCIEPLNPISNSANLRRGKTWTSK